MNDILFNKKLFKIFAYSIILLFLGHLIAEKFYLYYSVWCFDMIMHFCGGACAGFLVILLLNRKTFITNISSCINFKFFLKIILGVLFIGILWEFYEIIVNDLFAKMSFDLLDTLSDLFFDTLGGIFALFFSFKMSLLNSTYRV